MVLVFYLKSSLILPKKTMIMRFPIDKYTFQLKCQIKFYLNLKLIKWQSLFISSNSLQYNCITIFILFCTMFEQFLNQINKSCCGLRKAKLYLICTTEHSPYTYEIVSKLLQTYKKESTFFYYSFLYSVVQEVRL